MFAESGTSQTDIRFLRAALADLHSKGWCHRPKILDWPIAAMSAPVRDSSGSVAGALTFVVPSARATDPALAELLLSAAAECSFPKTKPTRQ